MRATALGWGTWLRRGEGAEESELDRGFRQLGSRESSYVVMPRTVPQNLQPVADLSTGRLLKPRLVRGLGEPEHMCDYCDGDIDETLEEFYERTIRPAIDRHGWYIQYVEGDRTHAPFAYTIGLTEHGCSELLVTGVGMAEAAALLNMGGEVVHRRPVRHGQRVTVAGRRVEVVVLPHPEVHLLFAADVYGPGLQAIQLVHADHSGVWPWSRGYRGGAGGQPVLGERAVGRRAG